MKIEGELFREILTIIYASGLWKTLTASNQNSHVSEQVTHSVRTLYTTKGSRISYFTIMQRRGKERGVRVERYVLARHFRRVQETFTVDGIMNIELNYIRCVVGYRLSRRRWVRFVFCVCRCYRMKRMETLTFRTKDDFSRNNYPI